MVVQITSRKADIKNSFKERVEKKLAKLDKFFDTDIIANVVVTTEKENEREKVEITIHAHGIIIHGEKTTTDMFDSLEAAVDAIVKQIVKNKTKLAKKIHSMSLDQVPSPGFSDEATESPEAEEEYKIVRRKIYGYKPMMVNEAILQMNMLGHDFFVFTDADTGMVNVVYKRKSGDYGLIIPSENQ